MIFEKFIELYCGSACSALNFYSRLFVFALDMNSKLLDTLGLSFQSLAEMELDIKEMSTSRSSFY